MIPNLQDPIRNYAYEQILNDLGTFRGSLLDIGTRDSKFAAYLATLGFKVTAIDLMDYNKIQTEYKNKYNTTFDFYCKDFLQIEGVFDVITSVYALQHSIKTDIKCYQHCAKLAKERLYIVNEFSFETTKFHLGRDDGDMRIYSMHDIYERILYPIKEIRSSKAVEMIFSKFDFPSQTIIPSTLKEANTITIKMYL